MKLSLAYVKQLETRIAQLERERELKLASDPHPFYFRKFPLGGPQSPFARVTNVSLRLENGEVVLRVGDGSEASSRYEGFLDVIDKWPR